MVPCLPLRARMLRFLLAALGALAALHSAGAPPDAGLGLDAPYAFQASDQALSEVLHGFAADHGLALRIGATAKSGWQTAKVDGWMRAPTGYAFLEQLAHAHHFSWFIADRALYASSASDSAVERIALNGARADHARAALEAVGVYDPRFGWGELTGQDAVLVGGPRAYRALVRRFLASRPTSGASRASPEPMIFPLRFAPAGDQSPSSGTVARPGVATLLRRLLGQESLAAQPAPRASPQAETPPPLPSVAPSLAPWIGYPALASALPAPSMPPASGSAGASPRSIAIVADEVTNAVIVWADPALRPAIERLVEALDRSPSLVSMDVFVIESDGATMEALRAASERAYAAPSTSSTAFDDRFAQAIADRRARLLNRQTLVGRLNRHATLTIGSEAPQPNQASDEANTAQSNGRSGTRGDRLDLAARIVPSAKAGATAIAIDVDLLLAQPTGLPGQGWTNTSSVKLDTAVTLESGAPPRLVASYPVASARAEQRAIFISAEAL